MKQVDIVLDKLEDLIRNNTYEDVETEIIELKNLPPNQKDEEYKSIKETICAFLNTDNGILIIGIKHEQKKKIYHFKGYDSNFEESIKILEKESVKDIHGNSIDLSGYIKFEIKNFMDGRVLIVYVDKLPHDKKYAFFNGVAYERKLTGDHPIEKNTILAQEEYKEEIKSARELFPVLTTTINNLSVDKLNEYIYWINKEYKIESAKADIDSAISFLERKYFITKDKIPTILGMLVCGEHPDDYLGNRCQVDCYVNSPLKIAQNKKVFKDNILQLLENSFRFIYSNIQIGISAENSGTATPEYPEDLVRECINNSLAHRDYTIDRFISIDIVPQKHIEIRNPGGFKKTLILEALEHEVPLRRIIPNQKPVNPRLADILKVFNKYEGKGIGMSTLVNECLKDKIDLPYYKFNSENDISLVIPSGKLLDDKIENLIHNFSGYIDDLTQGEQLSDDQKHVIAYLYKSEIENDNYHYTILLTTDNNHLEAIKSLEKFKIIYKHEKSTSSHPVFILDRVLMKTNFNQELITLFGNSFKDLKSDYKDCLKIIYQICTYSKDKYVKNAAQVVHVLYDQNNKILDIKTVDSFKRKIRIVLNKLEQEKFIKKENKKYYMNLYYKKNMFD